ncbi:MAG TPA: hypothetical protein VNA13_01750 [Xanthomonadales bacterium]|nr:hypothetical protein [Xanthomonadales bacterium]
MKKSLFKIMSFLRKHSDLLLFLLTFCISIASLFYFFFNGQMNLSNYDVIARLNASRKVIDSITPGVGQLGGIWLPFPQVLMLPFIWNDYLWRSGLAGYFVSGLSFIIGAVYLQKTTYLLTESFKTSLLIWFLFVSNINILLLQSMAMSEMFFMCCLILTCYYLISWIKTHDLLHFLLSAFFIMLLTLTRYEGYFILLGAFVVVILECIRAFRKEGRDKIEGMLLLFLTIAGFGIILWCIYSALFYKDPLFWLHAYSETSTSVIQGEKTIIDDVYGNLNPSLLESLGIYGAVVFLTNGIITVALGLLGVVLYVHAVIKKKISKQEILMFMPVGIISSFLFIFLIVGYYVGFIPHIEFPPVYLTGTKIREWSLYADSNIRYGMVLLPCLLLFIAFTATKNKRLFYAVVFCVAVQLWVTTARPHLLQFPFIASWKYPISTDAPWFKSHYDSGLVLISSARHEDFVFQSGLPYKKFIYEGTRDYWKESLNDPAKHARWVVYNDRISGDGITTNMTKEGYEILLKKFHLVYEEKGFKIYKLNAK